MISLKRQRTAPPVSPPNLRTCSITDNLAGPQGMIPSLLFDLQIQGAAVLTLLVLHLTYGRNKQVLLLVLSLCPPFWPARAAQLQGQVREEQVWLLTTGTAADVTKPLATSSCLPASRTTQAQIVPGTY